MPRKVSLQDLKADWSLHPRKAPWDYISSSDLSHVLNLPLQTVHNYVARKILPRPERNAKFEGLGNKNWFCIADIQSALEGKSKATILQEWISENLSSLGVQSEAQARYIVKNAYDVLGFDKPLI